MISVPRRGIADLFILGAFVLAATFGVAQQPANPLRRSLRRSRPQREIDRLRDQLGTTCHIGDLRGSNEAPALAGVDFITKWRARTTQDLHRVIQTTMPPSSIARPRAISAGGGVHSSKQRSDRRGPAVRSESGLPIGSVATGQAAPAAAPVAAAGGRGQAPAGGRGGGGRGQAAPQARGLTVQGEVKNFVPVTNECCAIRRPATG